MWSTPVFTTAQPVLINQKRTTACQETPGILNEAAVEGEKKAVALFEDLLKRSARYCKGGIEVIQLSPAESEKFLRTAYDAGWAELAEKAPKTTLS